MAQARAIYEAAKMQHPEIYANFDFENWLRFPINAGLLQLHDRGLGQPQTVTITPRGRDFLHYLVSNSLTACSASVGHAPSALPNASADTRRRPRVTLTSQG
jgi:hypothetical protein